MLKFFKFFVRLIDNDVIDESLYFNCWKFFKFMGFVGVFILLGLFVKVFGWLWGDDDEDNIVMLLLFFYS